MKTFFSLLLVLLLFSGNVINAQTANKDSLAGKALLKNELGIDMIFFLNLFRNQWESTNTTQLIINYDRWLNAKNALRFVWGVGFANNQVKQDTFPLLTDKTSNNIFKVGMKREQRMSKRWLFYYGVDLAFEYDYTSYQQGATSTGVQTTTEKNMYYGPSPFMGIRFEVNSHISFTTESNANLFFYNKNTTKENDKFPVQNTKSNTSGFSLAYVIPQNIFLKVKF